MTDLADSHQRQRRGRERSKGGAPPQPAAAVKVVKDSRFKNKTKHVIDDGDRAKAGSRLKSEAALMQSAPDAAQRIFDTLTAGRQSLKAFEIVSFAMAGHSKTALEAGYVKISGRPLSGDLRSAFSTRPGPKAADFLIDMLANDGSPSLTARLWVVFGKVDKSGEVARGLAKIPAIGSLIGNKGDKGRIVELFEMASQVERKAALDDAETNAKLQKLDSELHLYNRIRLLVEVADAEQEVTDAKDSGADDSAKVAKLATLRDEQLAAMVNAQVKKLPASKKIVKGLDGLGKLRKKLGGKEAGEQNWNRYKFDTKKFYDDLVDWRSAASADDIRAVQDPGSKFREAMRRVPENVVMGLTVNERSFIDELIGAKDSNDDLALGAESTQTRAVKQSLDRQAAGVSRKDTGRGAWIKSKLSSKLHGRKWRDIDTEIKLLNAAQRKAMLDEYATDPKQALTKLVADLKKAGFDKESRASIKAMFNVDVGVIGDRYAELWTIVDPGKTSKLKARAGYLKPTKWKKAKAESGKLVRGKNARKVIADLEDNEYALVRQDGALLAAIHDCSDDSTWNDILTLLGMSDENDQLQEDAPRMLVHKAKLAGEANPKRFALLLADAIDEEFFGSGVSAGRSKAQIYNIVDRARAAARLLEAEDDTDPKVFLRACLSELQQGKHGAKRYDYLRDRVPEAFDGLHNDVAVATNVRMDRAKHEGFGIGKLRKVDRQKLALSFEDLSGPELLAEWSNIDEFKLLRKEKLSLEQMVSSSGQVLADDRADDQARKMATEKFTNSTERLAQVFGLMQGFTLGIKESRRAEFKKLGVKAEDRISFDAMITDRLISAMKDDPDVQAELDDIDLPYDKYMQAKMKGVDALEMQRFLDTTRQWHMFSTKTSELSEATRNVKGSAVGSEHRLADARSKKTDAKGIAKLRKAAGEQTEEAVQDRALIEARFRDMQATFNQRAMLLFKLIVTAIVTGVTLGAGAPLSIFLHIAMEVGFNALETMYKAFVLGETDVETLAWGFAMSTLRSTVSILTANLSAGLLQSVMAPAAGAPQAGDWVAPALMKGMKKFATDMVMFAPEHMVERGTHARSLESVLKDGEGSMGDEALAQLGTSTRGVLVKLLVAGMKDGKATLLGDQSTVHNPQPKAFGQAMNDRMAGGANATEQEKMWDAYGKKKQKGAKKAAKKVVLGGAQTKNTKKAEDKKRKTALKDSREKPEKDKAVKAISSFVKERDLRMDMRAKRGDALLAHFARQGVSVLDLRSLSDEDKEKIEAKLAMNPGELDQLTLGKVGESLLGALQSDSLKGKPANSDERKEAFRLAVSPYGAMGFHSLGNGAKDQLELAGGISRAWMGMMLAELDQKPAKRRGRSSVVIGSGRGT